MGTVKGNIADCTVVTTDMGACAITTAKLGGSAVTNAKLGSSAVNRAKLDLECGQWWGGVWTVAATVSICLTFTGTSAFTILDVIVAVTAAGSTGNTMEVGTTANVDALGVFTLTTAVTMRTPAWGSTAADSMSAITGVNALSVEVSAAGSITFELTGTGSGTLKGKSYICYMKTPT